MSKPKRETQVQKKARQKAERERILAAMPEDERQAYMQAVNGTLPNRNRTKSDSNAGLPMAVRTEGECSRKIPRHLDNIDAND